MLSDRKPLSTLISRSLNQNDIFNHCINLIFKSVCMDGKKMLELAALRLLLKKTF
jgi:hypothetical protein